MWISLKLTCRITISIFNLVSKLRLSIRRYLVLVFVSCMRNILNINKAFRIVSCTECSAGDSCGTIRATLRETQFILKTTNQCSLLPSYTSTNYSAIIRLNQRIDFWIKWDSEWETNGTKRRGRVVSILTGALSLTRLNPISSQF